MKIICWVLVLPGLVWAVVQVAGWKRGPLLQVLALTPEVAAAAGGAHAGHAGGGAAVVAVVAPPW